MDGIYPLVAGITNEDLIRTIPKGSKDKIEKKIHINEEIHAPLKKGQSLGIIEYYLEGELLCKTDIVSTLNVDKIPIKTPADNIKSKWFLLLVIGIVATIIVLRIMAINKRKQRRKRRSSLYGIKSQN